jgi:hypothetical protein
MKKIAAILGMACLAANANDSGRRHPESELLARPAVRITVGLCDADIIGNNNRVLQAAVAYVGNLGGGVVERCAGFGLHPGSGSQRPSVKNCRAIANGNDGFFFCWRVHGGVAEGNWLENNGGYGVSIGHKYSDNFVHKNTIIGNKLGGVYWREETEPMAAHRITFESNTVRDNEARGLFVDGATHGTIIRSNIVEDTGSGRHKIGVRIGKHAGDVGLEGNTVKAETTVLDERVK